MSQPDEAMRAAPQPTSDESRPISRSPMNRRAGWVFWFQWVVASATGWASGTMIYLLAAPLLGFLAIGIFFAAFPLSFALVGSAFGAVIGTSFGFTQRLILRRYIHLPYRWVWSACTGSLLGGAIGGVIIMLALFLNIDLLYSLPVRPFRFQPFPVGYAVFAFTGAVGGSLVGRAQRGILKQSIGSANHWVWANVLGWAIGWAVSGVFSQVLTDGIVWPVAKLEPMAPVWVEIRRTTLIGLAVISGAVYSAVTGIALLKMLWHPNTKTFNEHNSAVSNLWKGLISSVVGIIVLLGGAGSIGAILEEGLQQCRWLDRVLNRSGCILMLQFPTNIGGTVAYSTDGAQLALRVTGRIHLLNLADGSLQVFGDASESARNALFLPTGDMIATVFEGTVQLRRIKDGTLLRVFGLPADQRPEFDAFYNAEFSYDGALLATGGAAGVQIWRVRDGELLRVIRVTSGAKDYQVNDLAFSPDGTLIATAPYAGGRIGTKVRVWRIADGELIHTLDGDKSPYVAFSPDGKMLASGSFVWRVSDGAVLTTLSPDDRAVVDFSPDGSLLAVAWRLNYESAKFAVRLWRVSDWIPVHTWYGLESPRLDALASGLQFSPDRSMLAFAFGERVAILQVPNE